jgi:hypothetical protein
MRGKMGKTGIDAITLVIRKQDRVVTGAVSQPVDGGQDPGQTQQSDFQATFSGEIQQG